MNVHTRLPSHATADDEVITGVNVFPQLSATVGGVGTVFVLAGHATVDEPFDGMVTTGALTVIVCTTLVKFPQTSVIL